MIGQKILILGNRFEALSTCLKKIVPKVYAQQDVSLFRKEIIDINPEIIFLDLSVGQSEESHKILNWILFNKRETLVLGYTETATPELMAHGVESGIEKSFHAPYNDEEISKLISSQFKSRGRVTRPLLEHPHKAQVSFGARISSVDENGIKLICSHYISKGVVFLFDEPLCREIFNQESILMIVTKTSQVLTGFDYEIYIEPKVSTEATSLALRRFIMSKE